jgi:REP element-mobilizing transposase RayT
MGRRDIFLDRRDREHFLELLEGVVGRYGVVLHAYVLMDNHYHLLIETPAGNASRALQWLNVSYAVWHNLRHGQSGSLFQARYKSIPVEGQGSWALVCSIYIHLNPVRIRALGLGKDGRALEKAGRVRAEATREQIRDRLTVLRGHRWSSYPAYAGYVVAPAWLTCEAIWARVTVAGNEPTTAYRRQTEDYI